MSSSVRFSPRETKFLLYFWGGASMKSAAASAGYKGSTPQSLCNAGRRVLSKFSNNPKALFRQAWGHEARIGQLLLGIVKNGKSEHQQLKVLTILSRCLGD